MGVNRLLAIVILVPLLVKIVMSQATLSSSDEQLTNSKDECFPGLVYEQKYNACQCVNATLFLEGVVCQGNQGQLRQRSFCITSDWEDPEQVIGGACPYPPRRKFTLPLWKLPKEDMNSYFCQWLNRNQTLCGKCADNYSLVINSYNFQCLPHTQCKIEDILIFLLSMFGPLTLFYCMIFLLQVNVAASYMFPYVLFAQTVSMFIIHIQTGLLLALKNFARAETLTKVLISIYSIWTLDIFTLFMPPICISDQIGNAQAIALHYAIALYPLLMILLSYLMVELYDRNFRVVTWMFFPIRKCFSLLQVRIDPISSLLTTFATFFFLSFSRMTITSLMLLSYTSLFAANGSVIRNVFLYDATMDYFGHEHLPYALLAIAITVIFLVLPLLLVFLYPTGILHNGLRFLFSSRQVQTLTTFMEVYQGHFKDGTDGTRDHRYFAGGQLLMRLMSFMFFFQTQEYTGLNFISMLILSVAWSLTILLFTPYKNDMYNKFEGIMTFYTTVTLGISYYNLTLELLWQPSLYLEMVLYVALFLPAIIAMLVCCIWIGRQCSCHWLQSKITFRRASSRSSTTTTSEVQQLETGADACQYSSSDHVLTSDRFAHHIG